MAKWFKTKDRILDTAFELFTTKSYPKVSIEDITKKAKVSKGGLFHHFESKYDLAVQSMFKGSKNVWMAPLQDAEHIEDPFVRFKRLIDVSIDIVFENQNFFKFMMTVHEEAMSKGKKGKMWNVFFKEYQGKIEKMFKDCKIPNPGLKSLIFMASLDAVGFEAEHHPHLMKKINRETLKREFYELFIGNYQKTKRRR
jgi:AcrR family transcriptional regulator